MSIIDDLTRLFAQRRLGWSPNPLDERDFDFEELGLQSVADHRTLRGYAPPALKQGGVPSCVAHAAAGAIMIRERQLGILPKIPSRLFMFFNSRRMHDNPVKLTGTYLRTCFKALQKFGVPDEEFWPYSTRARRINRRPGWDPYMKAFARRDGNYYAIRSTGDELVSAIKRAITAGYPVAFGTPVNRDFLNPEGPKVVSRPKSGIVGGHAMLIIGYETGAEGQTIFEVLNSWGPDWRHHGRVYLREDYIRWRRTHDFTIVRGWRRLNEKRK